MYIYDRQWHFHHRDFQGRPRGGCGDGCACGFKTPLAQSRLRMTMLGHDITHPGTLNASECSSFVFLFWITKSQTQSWPRLYHVNYVRGTSVWIRGSLAHSKERGSWVGSSWEYYFPSVRYFLRTKNTVVLIHLQALSGIGIRNEDEVFRPSGPFISSIKFAIFRAEYILFRANLNENFRLIC